MVSCSLFGSPGDCNFTDALGTCVWITPRLNPAQCASPAYTSTRQQDMQRVESPIQMDSQNTGTMEKSLFAAFPTLGKRLDCLSIAELPTPVESLPGVRPNLWIKRDDKTHPLYGGNKVRKLEFILAEVKKSAKEQVVTFGATGTNHGVATALFCQQQNIACEILLFDQPITRTVQQNLRLMQRFGAHLVHKGSLLRTVLAFYVSARLRHPTAYFLFAGGSNLAGCIGFVNAAFELKDQIQRRLLPEPDVIICPVGSSATVAGLTLGCHLAGLNSRVVGVRVAPSHLGIIPACTSRTVTRLMEQTYRHLQKLDTAIPFTALPEIDLLDRYYGHGYGQATAEGKTATAAFEQAGIALEATYTAKAAAAALDACDADPSQQVLYWHTFNSADMSCWASGADNKQLPKELQRLVNELI